MSSEAAMSKYSRLEEHSCGLPALRDTWKGVARGQNKRVRVNACLHRG